MQPILIRNQLTEKSLHFQRTHLSGNGGSICNTCLTPLTTEDKESSAVHSVHILKIRSVHSVCCSYCTVSDITLLSGTSLYTGAERNRGNVGNF